MLPPAGGATTTANGRSYSCASGFTLDVPDFDAFVLIANGWVNAAGSSNGAAGTVGTTSARPASPKFGQTFHDATLNMNIVFDGKVWRNPATGAAV
ncbi:hypothetical protein [Bradyrhizobium denitrificans]|uniref:hypothetical protein n=1 Tax=Bradyrhizobium denitrificans TaxID=2734912 RepID=UPI0015518748|nr:hypothetical protein [Bradyrhizobium sp. LMG 8443]NPU23951.1 hypothetical protein [Bradyrhizobium sp. LMG 8443]